MDNVSARKILELYRPGVDDGDPRFREALAQARLDPELARWLAERCALDAAIGRKLGEVAVPANLKGRILDEIRNVRPIPRWRSLPSLAAAAAMVLVLISGAWWIRTNYRHDFVGFQTRMMSVVTSEHPMDIRTRDLREIKNYLVRHHGHTEVKLTEGLQELPGEGGAILSWFRHPVSLICFESSSDRYLWLFVIDRDALPDPPPDAAPRYTKTGDLASAAWSRGNKTYLLIGSMEPSDLRPFL